MSTVVNALVQIVFTAFALITLDVLRGKHVQGRHSHDRAGTVLALAVVARALGGGDALKRYVSHSHRSHAFSARSSWVVMA